jgi:2-polyprenyl-6-methoxyphenol hydroxylase-like FAD-dependent oxidoreductase
MPRIARDLIYDVAPSCQIGVRSAEAKLFILKDPANVINMKESPVLIVGGGPVGLSLALSLARHGVRSTLFETKSEIDPHSRALGILPRTLEIFRTWGIYERFISEGILRTNVDFWVVGQTKPVAKVDLSVFARLSAVPGILILPQNRTEVLLLEAVKAAGLTETLPGHQAVSFQQESDGVSLEVTGPDGAAQTYRGQYLVGCDGSHSTVRESLGWELQGKTYPGRVLLADIRIRDERDQLPWPRLAPARGNVLVAARYQAEHWRILSTLEHNETEQAALESSSIDRRVHQLFGPGSYEHLWSNIFKIHCRTSPHFRQERILLAGDAGHVNSPAGGQGMNSGIQDAHNLAWKLARALAGADAETLLTSYEAERREAVINVDRYTDFLTRFGLLAPGIVQNAIGALFRTSTRMGLISHFAPKIGMLDTAYRHSPLVSGRGALVGHRAPDGDLIAPSGNSLRLLDLAGPQPVLLLFDDGRLPSWDVAGVAQYFVNISDLKIVLLLSNQAPSRPDAYRDGSSNGSLWNSWKVSGGAAALVRPDGYVGWMGPRPFPAELEHGVRTALGSSQ